MEMGIFWVALLVVLLVIEIITVGLTTIWFAGGALVALLGYAVGMNEIIQIILFVVVSLVLLCFTRPWAVKYINSNRVKTNYEGIIGKNVRITETVDNLNDTGTAVVGGQEWTARSSEEGKVLAPGTIAKVVNITGVKLIVEELKED